MLSLKLSICVNLGNFTEEEEEDEDEEKVGTKELDVDVDPGSPNCNIFEQCGQPVLINRQSNF